MGMTIHSTVMFYNFGLLGFVIGPSLGLYGPINLSSPRWSGHFYRPNKDNGLFASTENFLSKQKTGK